MTVDLVGIAAILVAVATPLTVVFTFVNNRKAINDARADAAKAAAEQKGILEAQNKVLAAQGETLVDVKHNTDGILSAAKTVGDKALAEVERVAAGGTPTKYGEPSAENPVTLSAGKAVVERPERTAPDERGGEA